MLGVSKPQRPRLLDMNSWSGSMWPRQSSRRTRRMRLLDIPRPYRASNASEVWTAGLIGGVVGALLVSAFWYVQTQTRVSQQTTRQLGLGSQGQSPDRSHIQMSSHPARQ